MGWSSYIRTNCGVKPACLGTAAGSSSGFVGASASGGTGRGTFHAHTAAESFHDGTAVNGGTAAYV